CAAAGTGIADGTGSDRSHPPPPQRHAIGYAASAVVWGKFLDFLGAGLRGLRSAGILRGCPSFRAFRETAGTFSKPRRGGCPHPPGWGRFSRSRTESAFTHLSFRGAPRREPAFKYLSFRIRFSGEETAFCPGAHPFAFFAKRRGLFPSHVGAGALTRPGGDFFRAAEGNLLSHTCHSEERRDESLLSNTCYFHRRWRMTTVDLSHSAHHVTTEFVLPVLEDADSIHITLGQIMRMIVYRHVDTKSAGLLLYALQIASANLRRTRFDQ